MATAPKRPRWNLSDLMGRLNAALPAKNVGRGAFSGEMHAPAPVVLSVREENYDELDASALVPRTLRVAAAFSWRTLVVVGLVTAVLWAAAWLTLVIMPVAIALTLAVLLEPSFHGCGASCTSPRPWPQPSASSFSSSPLPGR